MAYFYEDEETDEYLYGNGNWIAAWIGNLTEEELEDYLHEPGGAGDDEPISKFSADLNCFYDHDYTLAQTAECPQTPLELSRMGEFETCLVEDGVEAYEKELTRRSAGRKVTCLLLLTNAKVIGDLNQKFAEGKLTCIGSWRQPLLLSEPEDEDEEF
ncbi:Hypothetical protein PBC10988_16560 [Planctomycetales bacterium 10988]|nr:Hypothetical protein PBC10988_16560 [Planctomycetales bacterium 10988]